ncbi:hypothetical protein FHG87_002753 [Trinorchestia longiramus]|nr:hypothetical protein FHG87_002753 [Trinorchestia longiramus]
MELLPQPLCQQCEVPLTVEHFLAVSPSHAGVWRVCFSGLRGDDADAGLRDILAEPERAPFHVDSTNSVLFTISRRQVALQAAAACNMTVVDAMKDFLVYAWNKRQGC